MICLLSGQRVGGHLKARGPACSSMYLPARDDSPTLQHFLRSCDGSSVVLVLATTLYSASPEPGALLKRCGDVILVVSRGPGHPPGNKLRAYRLKELARAPRDPPIRNTE